MIVDDNEAVLDFLASLLESLGIAEVHRFQSARAALQAFSAAPRKFRFVITDLEMPDMNGCELASQLRAISPALKIVLVTGGKVVSEEVVKRWGFCGFLPKPFAVDSLWRIMESASVMNRSDRNRNN